MDKLIPHAPDIYIEDISNVRFQQLKNPIAAIQNAGIALSIEISDAEGSVWSVTGSVSPFGARVAFVKGSVIAGTFVVDSFDFDRMMTTCTSGEILEMICNLHIVQKKEEQAEAPAAEMSSDEGLLLAYLFNMLNPETLPDNILQARNRLFAKFLVPDKK